MNPVRKLIKFVAAFLLLAVLAVIALFSYLSITEYKPADKEAVQIDENSPADSDDSSFQFYLIDGFIVSDNIEVETLKTLDRGFVNSDHNPVYMTFTLKDAEP